MSPSSISSRPCPSRTGPAGAETFVLMVEAVPGSPEPFVCPHRATDIPTMLPPSRWGALTSDGINDVQLDKHCFTLCTSVWFCLEDIENARVHPDFKQQFLVDAMEGSELARVTAAQHEASSPGAPAQEARLPVTSGPQHVAPPSDGRRHKPTALRVLGQQPRRPRSRPLASP